MSQLFDDLIRMSAEQDQPQRLLFLFAGIDEVSTQNDAHNGALKPLMCVDKLPEELDSFDALVREADSINGEWQLVFIAGLGGQDGKVPSTEDAEPYLNQMTNDLASGASLARYLVLDRQQQRIEISPTASH